GRRARLRGLDLQSVERSDLVADLVDLARSSGAGEAAVAVDLADVAMGAMNRARARTPYADFALVTGPATLLGRPAALERAVVNLLDNAVKFGPADQTVEVTVTGSRAGPVVVLTVADRAATIPAGERERIFGRFPRPRVPARSPADRPTAPPTGPTTRTRRPAGNRHRSPAGQPALQIAAPPGGHLADHRFQAAPQRRQRVFDARWHLGVDVPMHQP